MTRSYLPDEVRLVSRSSFQQFSNGAMYNISMAFPQVKVLVAVFVCGLLLLLAAHPVQAACSPPNDYSSCGPNQHPDYNFGLRELQRDSAATPGLISFDHPLDPGAPQLTGLIKNNPYPSSVTPYDVVPMENVDSPGSWAEVTAIGIPTSSGQQVQLPASGYNIGDCHQGLVLYADSNSLTFKYTAEDNIVYGYTLHLEGLQVNSEIVSLYQQADAAGRGQLPALAAFESLGTTTGSELIVAIRDTGAFMDPRWQNDWWYKVYDTTDPCEPSLAETGEFSLYQAQTCAAGPGIPPDGPFRPAPCKNCSLNVPSPTNSCAEPFTLIEPASWTCGDLIGCPDQLKGRYFIKEVSWGADFALNTEQTKVPFAGYREIVTDENETVRSLNYYLNDYFEGTTLFDGKPFDTSDPEQVRKGIINAGVFRKLAPLEVQDDLREKLILSGLNYEVTDGTTTKHLQDWWTNPPLPPLRYPNGRFPPDRYSSTYLDDYREWLTTDWGKLWQRIPLFVREDSPGKVKLTVEHKPGELSPNTEAGHQLEQYSAEFPMAFPHLARLYEATDNLNQILLPTVEAARAEAISPGQPGEPIPCGSIFGEGIETALGCVPTTAVGLASWFIHYGSALAGGLAFLLMGYGAFLFITSAGNEEKIAQGKAIFTAALIGLLVVIGTVFLLRLIIVQILQVPGFARTPSQPVQLTQAQPDSPTLVAKAAPTVSLAQTSDLANNSPLLLAQAQNNNSGGNPPVRFEVVITGDPEPVGDGTYKVPYEVKIYSNRSDRGIHVRFYVNGGDPFGTVVVVDQSWGPFVVVDQWLPDLFIGEGQTISLSLLAIVDDHGELLDPQALQNCQFTFSNGAISSNCELNIILLPQPKSCTNSHQIDAECSGDNPQEDLNPNDSVCCDAQAHVEVPDYKIVAYSSYSDYEEACLCDNNPASPTYDPDCDPNKRHDVQMTRKVSVKLQIPYLEEIWKDSTEDEFGFFNLFRPAHFPKFPDNDALSNIRYQLTSTGTTTIDPVVGELYYPYLGGIQQTKKCISEQFLLPKALQPETNYCQFWEDYLRYQSEYDADQTSGFSVDDGSELDNMECQNADFEISDAAKQSAITTANQPWSWPENLLEERWEDVEETSQDHGWNPACVIALWIEESGGSDFENTGAKYSLGCEGATSADPNTNLNESLGCFFSRQDHEYYRDLEPGSREWWLVYAEGPNNSGVFDGEQANFPKNLYSWYQRLSF